MERLFIFAMAASFCCTIRRREMESLRAILSFDCCRVSVDIANAVQVVFAVLLEEMDTVQLLPKEEPYF